MVLAVPAAAPLSVSFARQLSEHSPLRPGDRVLVALSGGLDSVCLLHLLRFAPAFPLELCAAHFDHALRPASAHDARWVHGLCRAWRVPVLSERAVIPPRGEAAARALRYDFLRQAAGECGAKWILTAHHADDQLETILFRLARGTGLPGLCGIPERSGNIIRPLLVFRRAELLAYARRVGLRWRDDESNRSLGISRNRIRHVVLPALEAAWPVAASRLLELAGFARALERLWQQLLPELVARAVAQRSAAGMALARPVLREYHPQTRARVLRELAHQLGEGLGRAATTTALQFIANGESGTEVRLGARLKLHREFERLTLEPADPRAGAGPDLSVRIERATAGSGLARIGGAWFDVRWGPIPPGTITGASASFDPSVLCFPLLLRGWRPGDRIRLRYGTKKLKKLFAERRIPRSRRAVVPVLAEQAEHAGVLWIAGVAQAATPIEGSERWHITVNHGESA